MSPDHIAAAIKLRERGWKWSDARHSWYKRVPGTDLAVATRDTRAALAVALIPIVRKP